MLAEREADLALSGAFGKPRFHPPKPLNNHGFLARLSFRFHPKLIVAIRPVFLSLRGRVGVEGLATMQIIRKNGADRQAGCRPQRGRALSRCARAGALNFQISKAGGRSLGAALFAQRADRMMGLGRATSSTWRRRATGRGGVAFDPRRDRPARRPGGAAERRGGGRAVLPRSLSRKRRTLSSPPIEPGWKNRSTGRNGARRDHLRGPAHRCFSPSIRSTLRRSCWSSNKIPAARRCGPQFPKPPSAFASGSKPSWTGRRPGVSHQAKTPRSGAATSTSCYRLTGRSQKVEHHPALPYADISRIHEPACVNTKACPSVALEFTILTVCRTGEVTKARRAEIDWKQKIWTVPGERMKAGKEHRVPLTEQRHSNSGSLAGRGREPDYLFMGAAAANRSATRRWRRLMKEIAAVSSTAPDQMATVHGMRSTFRDGQAR